MPRMPVIFFGHGSPGNALEDNEFTRSWAKLGAGIHPAPKAILSVSAHWCTRGTAVTAMDKPKTIHDFGGFSRELNTLQYPADGSPELAQRVVSLLSPRPIGLDKSWGLDHGTWSVLVHAFPEAGIPVIQLSMDVSMSAEDRYAMGRKLAALRDEGVLIIGTGNIVHNLGTMDWNPRSTPYPWAQDFHNYIGAAIRNNEPAKIIGAEGLGRIAGMCHPSPDHFWPLLYVMGTRQADDKVTLYTDKVMHKSLSMTSLMFHS